MKLSIVIPTRNEEQAIGGTLNNLNAGLARVPHEIIVSDGKSSDHTVRIAQKYADRVIETRGAQKETIGAGRNRGGAAARGEYLAFLDADVFIKDPAEFFAAALSDFENDPSLAGLTGKIRVLPDRETAGDRFVFGFLNAFHRIMNNALGMGRAPGEFQMVRAKTFKKLGGYNENLAASEDYEFFSRLAKIGKTRFDPRLVIFHTGRRAHAIGWPRLLSEWFLNALSVSLKKRSASKQWEPIREEPEKKIPVSVIIPTLNEERYLPRLLESLIADASDNLEIIVVDGRSEDRTREVVKKLQRKVRLPSKLQCIISDKRNVAHQRNLGVSRAHHETIVFLDADIIIPSLRNLRMLISKFKNGKYTAASCRYVSIEKDWRARLFFKIFYWLCKATERWYPHVLGSCIITTKKIFKRVGGFDPEIRVGEDANFALKASKIGAFRMIPVPLYVSARRFTKNGYLKMSLVYLKMFFMRSLGGEIKEDKIPYEFGKND